MKTFLVYNTSFFGDMILTNPLCRQLKRVYPHSHLVFISDKTYADVARYMDGVDEVWIYDKHKNTKELSVFTISIKNIRMHILSMRLLSFMEMNEAFFCLNY